MGWLQIVRFAAIGLAALSFGVILHLAWDRGHQKALADAAARCELAADTSDKPLDDCAPHILARVSADRRTIVCESALLPALTPETRFTASQACGPGTLRLIVAGDAQLRSIAGLTTQIDAARADTGAAIARAETRARTEQSRRDHAQQLIQAAPRGADGRVACDADCLRRLAR